MSKIFLHRTLAFVYTNLMYRNSDLLEKRHCTQIAFDHEFYAAMYSEVSVQFSHINRILADNMADKKPETDEEAMTLEYVANLIPSFQTWDSPKKVRDHFTGDLAEFVLHGRFKQACENHEVPTDVLMKELNIDVNDRFFTLLSRGII